MTDWNAILASEGPLVWRTLWRLLADRTDVEECFQDTFLAALVLSRRESVQCWPALLCSLATARGLDRLRQRYRRDGRSRGDDGGACLAGLRVGEPATTEAGPVEQAIATELSDRLREALSQLPEKQAEVFYLHALCGWSHRQLGERMNMSDSTVGVTLHRARKRLRDLLTGDE
jgi:RNA polymerase sigma factor (sigma-70 family)